MQEIKKRRIVIASVLKPVNDTRMFEKLGISLSRVAEVHVAGYPAPTVTTEGIVFHPSKTFSRLSLHRLIQPWKVYHLFRMLRPTDIIVTTHELLFPAVACKLFFGSNVYYDLQENYWRNIMFTKTFPGFLRPFLAGYVRMKERLVHRFIHTYLVAEKGYLKEMPFIRRKSVVLENRYKESGVAVTPHGPRGPEKTILFSGTLSRSTGVFSAVTLARKLFALDPRIRLTIVGFCPRRDEYRDLIAAISGCSFITLHGGDALIAHTEIVRHIRESDIGLIAYEITPATENRLPTKVFEYLANGLTVVTTPHPPWLDFIRQYQEPVIFDPTEPDAQQVLAQIQRSHRAQGYPRTGLLWSDVEPTLLALFRADG